jgi:hypothetical protein
MGERVIREGGDSKEDQEKSDAAIARIREGIEKLERAKEDDD